MLRWKKILWPALALFLVGGTWLTEAADPNSFNRLLPAASKRNPAPPDDGIHDPVNEGTHMLQLPKEAFGELPKAPSGNYIDWVKALESKKIQPRYDRQDASVEPIVMDLNIIREVKGSMPDVVYPHKQHTEWLDCSNCHPAIFVPQKGANQISMAGILLGEKCGVCHGKVAFPVSECVRCHSKPKTTTAEAAARPEATPKAETAPKPAAKAEKPAASPTKRDKPGNAPAK